MPQAGNSVPPLTESGSPADNAETQTPGTVPQPTLAAPGLVTGISLGELYTDNLTLAGSGQAKETSFITQIEPFLKSAYNSPRFSSLLDYSVAGYFYPGETEHNQAVQTLNGQATLTLIPQHFFMDGTASYDRQIINNALPSSSSPYLLTNNSANAAAATLSPYWVQDFDALGTMTLRYSHGRVVYNDQGIPAQDDTSLNGVSNVTSNEVNFSLISPVYGIWSWNLGYADQRLDPDAGTSVEYAALKLGSGLQVTSQLQLLADVGKENNFLPDGSVEYLEAHFWDAGFNWANGLDALKILVGHRFFGSSYLLSWTHTAALLTTNLSYREQPTDYNQQLLGVDPTQAILAPAGIPSIPSLTELQPYLSKRASGSVTYTAAKSTLTLTLYNELRTYYELNSSQERVANADLAWLFNIGVFTTLTPAFGWQRYQFQDGQVNYTTYGQLALAHQFGVNDSGSLSLRYDSRNVYYGQPGANGYGARIIFVQWTHIF